MKIFLSFGARAAVAAIALLAAVPGYAATLVYDDPVIYLAPGETATVCVTLYAPGLRTDASGGIIYEETDGLSFFDKSLQVAIQYHTFLESTAFPNPLANLDLTSVPLVHFNIGTVSALCGFCFIQTPDGPVVVGPATPEGVYTTKFAIWSFPQDTAGPVGPFADPGSLTVIVTSETPLPGSLVLFGSGLVAATAVARRRSSKQSRHRNTAGLDRLFLCRLASLSYFPFAAAIARHTFSGVAGMWT